jgi:hypothetical protein
MRPGLKGAERMLRSVEALSGYTILARDDTIGTVDGFYFDDLYWTIRYLVVDTGTWLTGRKVLISPLAVGQPDWETHLFPVELTRNQVKNSPEIDLVKPVSRQLETELHRHYEWPAYWSDVSPGSTPSPQQGAPADLRDPHLRSTKEVIGYDIQARDGKIGHVEDFVTDDQDWTIRYMVVDTRDWLPGRKVLVSPQWVEQILWSESDVHVDLARETIKRSPEYDPSAPVNRDYEERLYDYYGRPKYWLRR